LIFLKSKSYGPTNKVTLCNLQSHLV